MIVETFKAGALIMDQRGTYKVLACLTEEVGELSTEIKIANGDSYKEAGIDGIIGEAVDVIICALDMIRVNKPTVTEEEVMTILKRKLDKWKAKELERILKIHNGRATEQTQRHRTEEVNHTVGC